MPVDATERLENLLRHVAHVRDNCELLGGRLIQQGEESDGLALVANGHVHDNSKFRGIEWEHLNDNRFPRPDPDPDRELFLAALKQHVTTNPHHPEYWGGVKKMPPIFLGEMVCDWKARSNEQGTDLVEWVRGKAASRFGYTPTSRVGRTLLRYVGILLERKM